MPHIRGKKNSSYINDFNAASTISAFRIDFELEPNKKPNTNQNDFHFYNFSTFSYPVQCAKCSSHSKRSQDSPASHSKWYNGLLYKLHG